MADGRSTPVTHRRRSSRVLVPGFAGSEIGSTGLPKDWIVRGGSRATAAERVDNSVVARRYLYDLGAVAVRTFLAREGTARAADRRRRGGDPTTEVRSNAEGRRVSAGRENTTTNTVRRYEGGGVLNV